ncbi:unnamed protein product, partial [Discosporangium mesarthrocarpum]
MGALGSAVKQAESRKALEEAALEQVMCWSGAGGGVAQEWSILFCFRAAGVCCYSIQFLFCLLNLFMLSAIVYSIYSVLTLTLTLCTSVYCTATARQKATHSL